MQRTKTRKPRKITPAQRRRIEKTVERLIEALDHMDAPAEDLEDPADAEPNGDEDEPSLGASESHPAPYLTMSGLNGGLNQENWTGSGQMLHEVDCEKDDSDDEPSLCGITADGHCGSDDDREDEHDGREPDDDKEPALGSLDTMLDQEKSYRQVGDAAFWVDYEEDPAECGIADEDGLREQVQIVGLAVE